jgi:hypothetical protein
VNAPARLAVFAAALVALFGAAVAAGGAIGPDREPARAAAAHGAAAHGDAATTHGARPGHDAASHAADPVRGLAVAEDGLRVVVADPELARGRTERLRFRILDGHGATVRDFDVAHARRMHLILARRDLTGFQHLHPRQAADGSWAAPVRIDASGSYRLFADFTRAGAPHTLSADLRVDGPADLRPLPAPAATATSDGGQAVRLDAGRAAAGREASLRFTVTEHGARVATQPYLGAGGHLVVLREGDLAFLHVHPTDGLAFAATFPTAGRYRLFLQYRSAGRVHTAAFTREVGPA